MAGLCHNYKTGSTTLPEIGVKELLEAGVHFGHQTRRWNPKMRRFIFGERDGIYIIDLLQTEELLERARQFAGDLARRGGTILFVGTKKQARDVVKEVAESSGMPYVNHRWLGGLLTNFQTISLRINRLHDLERYEAEGQLQLLPTRERIAAQADLEKLRANLGGVKNMQRVPQAVFVIDLKTEAIAVREAQRLRIPIIGLVDTNCDPDGIDFVIPGNDDAIRSCAAITRAIGDVVADAYGVCLAAEEGRDWSGSAARPRSALAVRPRSRLGARRRSARPPEAAARRAAAAAGRGGGGASAAQPPLQPQRRSRSRAARQAPRGRAAAGQPRRAPPAGAAPPEAAAPEPRQPQPPPAGSGEPRQPSAPVAPAEAAGREQPQRRRPPPSSRPPSQPPRGPGHRRASAGGRTHEQRTPSAQDVKELRGRTGAGINDCRNALIESEGDFDRAVEILRTRARRRPRSAPAPRPARARCRATSTRATGSACWSRSIARPTSSPAPSGSSSSRGTSRCTSPPRPLAVVRRGDPGRGSRARGADRDRAGRRRGPRTSASKSSRGSSRVARRRGAAAPEARQRGQVRRPDDRGAPRRTRIETGRERRDPPVRAVRGRWLARAPSAAPRRRPPTGGCC